MTTEDGTGRANQKKRTRTAIIEACRELISSGVPVTMPDVARAAFVSEATAYRYFPDLAALLNEALADLWLSPAQALSPVADSRARDRNVRPGEVAAMERVVAREERRLATRRRPG